MIRRQRHAHTRIWTVLAIALPMALVMILANTPGPAPERPPVRLEEEAGG